MVLDKSAKSLATVLQILAKCNVERLPILQWSTVLKNLMHAGLGEVNIYMDHINFVILFFLF